MKHSTDLYFKKDNMYLSEAAALKNFLQLLYIIIFVGGHQKGLVFKYSFALPAGRCRR